MDTEGFELDVIAIILLRRVRKRRFKKTLENNGFVLYLKRGNRKMQNRKTFIIQILVFFTISIKFSPSLKLHLFVFPMFMNFFQLKNDVLKIFSILINQITNFKNVTSITFPLYKSGFSNKKRTSVWVLSCKFAVYFQNTFSSEHLWNAASVQNLNISKRRLCLKQYGLRELQ